MMKKHLLLLALLLMSALLFCACMEDTEGTPAASTKGEATVAPSSATTEKATEPSETTGDATTEPTTSATEPGTTEPSTSTTEPSTTEPNTSTNEPSTTEPSTEETVLELKWNLGYVGSSTNTSHKNELFPTGGSYSYTDVFTVAKAGTTITFCDSNTNDGGDGKYASAAAYVVSSWKKVNNEWVLDLDGANYPGSASSLSKILVSYENGVVTYSYTTSIDNENLRLCYRSGQKPSTTVLHPTVTAQWTGKTGTAADIYELRIWIEESKKTSYHSILEGLTINAIGDSYFAGSEIDPAYVWVNMMGKKYGQNMNNYGIGGSSLSNCANASNPMCNRYQNMAKNSPNIVLIEGGRNDYNKGAAIGTVTSRDTATFMGALNTMIDGVKQMYPDAMIVCVTNWNFPNNRDMSLVSLDYANAMRSVAEAQGVYCIYAYDPAVSGVDMTNEAFRTKYNIKPADVSHLNEDGMKYVLPYFEKALAECYEDFLYKNTTYSVLKNLTVNAIGDSYIAPASSLQKWPDLLTEKYGWTLVNEGISGCTISNYVTNRNPICDRFDSMIANNPQIVIIEGGRNDFNQKTPIGTLNSTDTKTFMGALNVIIDGMQTKYPNAMIVCVTPWKFPNKSTHTLTYKDYVDAMMQVAEAQGVYCIDASDTKATGVDMTDSAFRAEYCTNPDDVSHLNAAGMELVRPFFDKMLAEYYTDFLKKVA